MPSDQNFSNPLADKIAEALVSCQALFPDSSAAPPFFALLMRTLASMREDIRSGRTKDLLIEPCGLEEPDSAALLNQLSGVLPPNVYFSSFFDNAVLDELSRRFPGADIASLLSSDDFSYAKSGAVSDETEAGFAEFTL